MNSQNRQPAGLIREINNIRFLPELTDTGTQRCFPIEDRVEAGSCEEMSTQKNILRLLTKRLRPEKEQEATEMDLVYWVRFFHCKGSIH